MMDGFLMYSAACLHHVALLNMTSTWLTGRHYLAFVLLKISLGFERGLCGNASAKNRSFVWEKRRERPPVFCPEWTSTSRSNQAAFTPTTSGTVL